MDPGADRHRMHHIRDGVVTRIDRRPTDQMYPSDCAEMSGLLQEQIRQIAALREEVEVLRVTCERAQMELLRRVELVRPVAIQAAVRSPTGSLLLGDAQPPTPAAAGVPFSPLADPVEKLPPMTGAEYSRLVTRIRSLARTVLPVNAVVAVVSRGDEALVELEGRIAWHFPRLEDGRWAGHHPADGQEAVAHLELARRRGARYLLIPATALWWLDHYGSFRDHLDDTSASILRRDDACRIFALNPTGAA